MNASRRLCDLDWKYAILGRRYDEAMVEVGKEIADAINDFVVQHECDEVVFIGGKPSFARTPPREADTTTDESDSD